MRSELKGAELTDALGGKGPNAGKLAGLMRFLGLAAATYAAYDIATMPKDEAEKFSDKTRLQQAALDLRKCGGATQRMGGGEKKHQGCNRAKGLDARIAALKEKEAKLALEVARREAIAVEPDFGVKPPTAADMTKPGALASWADQTKLSANFKATHDQQIAAEDALTKARAGQVKVTRELAALTAGDPAGREWRARMDAINAEIKAAEAREGGAVRDQGGEGV